MMTDNKQTSNGTDLQALTISRLINGLSLLAVDHKNLRGLVIKGRPSPMRQQIFLSIAKLFKKHKFQKIHPQVFDNELFGGLDFARTFETGRPVHTCGFLKQSNSLILLSMAERLDANLVSKYAKALDVNKDLHFIVSDESTENENINDALTDRLAFYLSIENIHYTQAEHISFNLTKIEAAKKALPSISIKTAVIKTLTEVSLKLGIDSLRAPILASYVARASAAFSNNAEILEKDILTSIELVLSHRAKVLPHINDFNDDDNRNEPAHEMHNEESYSDTSQANAIPPEILLDAIKSSLSPEVLKHLTDRSKNLQSSKTNSGAGKRKLSNRRGRPLPSRSGKLDNTKRLDITETLKSAAPWQKIRKKRSTN